MTSSFFSRFLSHLWQTLRSFSFREKLIVGGLFLLIIGAFSYWMYALYIQNTDAVPASGGVYIEGMVGNPLYVNPVLAKANAIDYDLSRLLFSGLMQYDKYGNLVGDLAVDWEISDDGKVYRVFLKNDVRWHDGEVLNADDVLFTVDRIKNLAYKSPLREPWLNIEASRGQDDYSVVFTLDSPRVDFLELLTVGILPKHVWEGVVPENFALHRWNLEPIGSGPYRFKNAQKDADGKVLIFELSAFEDYYEKIPYIDTFIFKFYPDRDSVMEAYKNKEIRSMSGIDAWAWDDFGEHTKELNLHAMRIPHYYVSYFNHNKSEELAYDEVRKAIALATNRRELVDRIYNGRANEVQVPFLENMGVQYISQEGERQNNIEEANEILQENGWERGDDGVRQKDDMRLEFDMITADWREFTMSADILRDQWSEIGVKVNVKVVTVYDLWNNFIKTREYELVMFAHTTMLIPDIYPYWHSSKTQDPGLNLAVYKNDDMDALIEKLRITQDISERQGIVQDIQSFFSEEQPSLYLFSPYYLYPVDESVRGIVTEQIAEHSDRFFGVEDWYIKTKRVWKEGVGF
jgi:peptide/nickel transport system substrate-binding protein